MTNSSISFFGRLALPTLLAALLMSCQQEITIQKDPHSLKPGNYALTGAISYTIAGAVSSVPVSGTLSVFAGDQANVYYFLEKLKGYNPLGYQVMEGGSAFAVEPVYESTRYQNLSYYGKQNGGGTVTPSRIDVDRYADTNAAGITLPTGELIKYTLPIRKRVVLVATR